MGQVIGQYVHYHWENYQRYGTNRNSGDNDYMAAYNDTKQFLTDQIGNRMIGVGKKSEDLDYLKKILNYCFDGNHISEENEQYEEIVEKIWEETIEDMINEFQGIVGKINQETGDITATNITRRINNIKKDKDKIIQELKTETKNNQIALSTIQSRIEVLKNLLRSLQWSIKKNGGNKKIKELAKNIEEITDEYNKINKILKDAGQESVTVDQATNKIIYGNESSNLINDINKMLVIFQTNTNMSFQKGEFFEFLIKNALSMRDQIAEEEVHNIVKKLGNEFKDAIQIDADSWFPNITKEQLKDLNLKYSDDGKKLIVQNLLNVKNKIDVSFENVQNNTNIRISAKNYNLNNISFFPNIGIFSGSLQSLLNGITNINFINHYLNCAVSHPDSGDEGTQYSIIKTAMKEAMLWQSLTGTFSKPGVNVFIINNNQQKNSVDIIRMDELFNTILGEDGSMALADVLINGKDIERYQFNNIYIKEDKTKDRETAIAERIYNLLSQIAKGKVKTKINKKIFT